MQRPRSKRGNNVFQELKGDQQAKVEREVRGKGNREAELHTLLWGLGLYFKSERNWQGFQFRRRVAITYSFCKGHSVFPTKGRYKTGS